MRGVFSQVSALALLGLTIGLSVLVASLLGGMLRSEAAPGGVVVVGGYVKKINDYEIAVYLTIYNSYSHEIEVMTYTAPELRVNGLADTADTVQGLATVNIIKLKPDQVTTIEAGLIYTNGTEPVPPGTIVVMITSFDPYSDIYAVVPYTGRGG